MPSLVRMPRFIDRKIATLDSYFDFVESGGAPRHPLAMYVEISNICNFKCVMCTVFSALNEKRASDVKSLDRGFMKFDETMRERLEAILPSLLYVRVFGFGEPTIHPNFFEILELISRYEVGISFFTNGSKITPAAAEKLVDIGVHEVTFSMSGATPEDYQNLYIGGKFEQIREGIRSLSRAKRAAGKKFPRIFVNSLSFLNHLEKFDSFVEILAEDGVDVVRITELTEFDKIPALDGHSRHFDNAFLRERLKKAEEIAAARGIEIWTQKELLGSTTENVARPKVSALDFKELAKKTDTGGVAIDEVTTGLFVPNEATGVYASELLELEKVSNEDLTCPEPFHHLYWSQSGNVFPCCHWNPSSVGLGNVEDASLDAIWNGPGYDAARVGVKNGIYSKGGCSGCVRSHRAPQPDWPFDTIRAYLDWYEDRFGVTALSRFRDATEGSKSIVEGVANYRSNVSTRVPETEWSAIETRFKERPRLQVTWKRYFEGNVEDVTPHRLTGWMWMPTQPHINVPIRIFANGQMIGEVPAENHRSDLVGARKGHGNYGFSFDLPSDLSRPAQVWIELGATGMRFGPKVTIEAVVEAALEAHQG